MDYWNDYWNGVLKWQWLANTLIHSLKTAIEIDDWNDYWNDYWNGLLKWSIEMTIIRQNPETFVKTKYINGLLKWL